VGSSTKDSGKTTFIGRVVSHFKDSFDITCVKFRPDDSMNFPYNIIQEFDQSGSNDTSKYLMSGAKKSFYVKSKRGNYLDAFEELFSSELLIVESNYLVKFVTPAVFIMLNSDCEKNIKESARDFLLKADRIVTFDKTTMSFDFDCLALEIKNNCWKLKK